jgi:hypothetical protein
LTDEAARRAVAANDALEKYMMNQLGSRSTGAKGQVLKILIVA